MASSNLVGTSQHGSTGGSFTWYHGISRIPNYDTRVFNGTAYLGHRWAKPESPYGKIEVAGVSGVFPKWWGRKSSVLTVKGVIIARAADIGTAETQLDVLKAKLLRMADAPDEWQLSGPTSGLVSLDVIDFDMLGENSGGKQFFTAHFFDPRG